MVKWLKVGALAVVALLVAASASGDSNTYNYQDNGTAKFNPKSGQRVDATGNAQVVDAGRDRDLDYYASVVNAVTIDTTKDACIAFSGVIDLRAYQRANLIIHLIPAAGDTVMNTISTYDFGITVHALPTQSYDWTGYGVPVTPNPSFAQSVSLYGAAGTVDSLGFWTTPGTSQLITFPGEVMVRLKNFYATRTSALSMYYQTGGSNAQFYLGRTVSYPLSYFLAPGQGRPRFVGIRVRAIARTFATAPTVRVDVEGLR